MNWNLRLAYLNTVFFGVAMGIFQTAFAIFITQGLSQPNAILGGLFTISGVTMTLFILPSGYFADKFRRDLVIRLSVVFGVLGPLLLIIATFYASSPYLALNFLIISQISGGIAWGLASPASQALIADSITTGNRSKYFASLRFYEEIAITIGPVIALIMTIIFGDTWSIDLLRIIILFAAICEMISFMLAGLMSDRKGLPVTSSVNSQDSVSMDLPTDSEITLSVPMTLVISGLIIGFVLVPRLLSFQSCLLILLLVITFHLQLLMLSSLLEV